MTIYVSGLNDMPAAVRRFGIRHLVSVVQEEFQPPTPPEIAPARHHRCAVDDIVEPMRGHVLPGTDHVRDLVGFLATWDGESPLLVHCLAGVSRSTATAFLAHAMQTDDALLSAVALRRAAPYAWPNRRIIELADAILGMEGKLVHAGESMGAALCNKEPGQVAVLPVSK